MEEFEEMEEDEDEGEEEDGEASDYGMTEEQVVQLKLNYLEN